MLQQREYGKCTPDGRLNSKIKSCYTQLTKTKPRIFKNFRQFLWGSKILKINYTIFDDYGQNPKR